MADNTDRPDLRHVRARVLTAPGWMIGTFHVPRPQSFHDFLNEDRAIFKLTDVTTGSDFQRPEFLAVRRQEVMLVVPEVEVDVLKLAEPPDVAHVVSCWMPTGEVVGTLNLDKGVRVSDYLMEDEGFAVLRECTGRDTHQIVNEATVVFVNAERVIGVVDRTNVE